MTSEDFALRNHKLLKKEVKSNVGNVGILKKVAIDKAVNLKDRGVYVSHLHKVPSDGGYYDFVNQKIKDAYREKLENLEGRIDAHVNYLEGNPSKKSEAEAMLRHVRAAKDWATVLPDDGHMATAYEVPNLEEQKQRINRTLEDLGKL